jgi:ABC-type Fe3+ transport system permease subunit
MDQRDAGGRKGPAIGIAVLVVAAITLLPLMIAFGFYAFAQVQAIVTGSDLSSQTLNIPVFLTVLVGTVALLILVMCGAAALIGRSFTPRRRPRRDESLGEAEDLAEITQA